jgi:hypothetical protein
MAAVSDAVSCRGGHGRRTGLLVSQMMLFDVSAETPGPGSIGTKGVIKPAGVSPCGGEFR